MDFLVHIVVTALGLLVVSRLLRDVEVSNLFTALLAAAILGVLHALMGPLAERTGHRTAEFLATKQMAYPVKLVILFLPMIVINALLLKLVARIGPGFRIGGFGTAMLAALLLVMLNWLLGEAISFAKPLLSDLNQPPPA